MNQTEKYDKKCASLCVFCVPMSTGYVQSLKRNVKL